MSIELFNYLQRNTLSRLKYPDEIFKENFFDHPITLLFGLLPTLGTVAQFLASFNRRRRDFPIAANSLILFLTVYCAS